MQSILNEDAIQAALIDLPGWRFEGNAIHREYNFSSFTEAMGFITEMAFACERMNHHPKLFNVYNKVQIHLTTHDVGNKVTEKDLNLAKAIAPIALLRLG
jgi:4a-hydroxytetrahydrobiopterin dehydratase